MKNFINKMFSNNKIIRSRRERALTHNIRKTVIVFAYYYYYYYSSDRWWKIYYFCEIMLSILYIHTYSTEKVYVILKMCCFFPSIWNILINIIIFYKNFWISLYGNTVKTLK